MLKMLIRMDNHKIETEQKYNSESIYSTLNNAFSRMRFQRISDETNALVYCDNETGQTHGSFCQIINSLKKQGWFMENVSDCITVTFPIIREISGKKIFWPGINAGAV